MALLVALLVMGATGCSTRKRVVVDSNTCWSGQWDGERVHGCGRRVFETRASYVCYVFKKDTRRGWLHVDVTHGVGDDERTDAPYGVITGCVP